jgi:hypothetical protein
LAATRIRGGSLKLEKMADCSKRNEELARPLNLFGKPGRRKERTKKVTTSSTKSIILTCLLQILKQNDIDPRMVTKYSNSKHTAGRRTHARSLKVIAKVGLTF